MMGNTKQLKANKLVALEIISKILKWKVKSKSKYNYNYKSLKMYRTHFNSS